MHTCTETVCTQVHTNIGAQNENHIELLSPLWDKFRLDELYLYLFLCPLVPLNPSASSSTSLLSPMAFQRNRFTDCHIAVGNNTSLSIKHSHCVVMCLIFSTESQALVSGVNVNILKILIKHSVFCSFWIFQRSSADVGQWLTLVHLFVWVCGSMWSFNIVYLLSNDCYSNQRSRYSQGWSRYVILWFWNLWLNIIITEQRWRTLCTTKHNKKIDLGSV